MNMEAQKVYEKLSEPAGNMVKAAIQQSLKKALESLIESYYESNGEQAKQQIVLKACCLQLSESRFSFEVESVTVTKKITFTDDDFEAVEVDLNQPDLPGMNQ
jgi:hypothetical protein